MGLTEADVDRYRTDGVLAPAGAVSTNALGELQHELDTVLEWNKWPNADFIPDIIRRRPEWLRFAMMPELVDPVRELIGDDVILWGSGLFCKSAEGGRGTRGIKTVRDHTTRKHCSNPDSSRSTTST